MGLGGMSRRLAPLATNPYHGTMDSLGFLSSLLQQASQVWNLTLCPSGDGEVHLNQVVLAFIIIFIGFRVSKCLYTLLGRRLLRKQRVDAHTALFIQKLLHYFLLALIVLAALPIAGIPIPIFTVLGGAFAIGVGFGAQNLFNILISGLILILEQPIRLGDVVELDSGEGRIADIGNRCVRVRRPMGWT